MIERVIAIDFDGTLFENKFPKIGQPIWSVINKAKKEKENGSKLILWTCRSGEYLKDAIKACEDVGLRFDCINESLTTWVEKYNNDCRKIGATEYWDDKAINPVLNLETLPIVQELRAELEQAKQELRQVKYCYEIAENGEKQLRRQVDEITGAWAECAKKLEHVTAERDAAVSQLHGYCSECKNYTGYHGQGPCATCCHKHFLASLHTDNDNWEWKGV